MQIALLKKLQMKHSDALDTHNRAIQEHLSAEELLWKEKETLNVVSRNSVVRRAARVWALWGRSIKPGRSRGK